jgi:hypothetical protein
MYISEGGVKVRALACKAARALRLAQLLTVNDENWLVAAVLAHSAFLS